MNNVIHSECYTMKKKIHTINHIGVKQKLNINFVQCTDTIFQKQITTSTNQIIQIFFEQTYTFLTYVIFTI